MTHLLTAVLLAAPQPGDYDPSTGKGPEWGKAAPIGLLVILLLGVAMFFLLRSFTRQLKKVPTRFDTEPPDSIAPTASLDRMATVPAADDGVAPPGDEVDRDPSRRDEPAG